MKTFKFLLIANLLSISVAFNSYAQSVCPAPPNFNLSYGPPQSNYTVKYPGSLPAGSSIDIYKYDAPTRKWLTEGAGSTLVSQYRAQLAEYPGTGVENLSDMQMLCYTLRKNGLGIRQHSFWQLAYGYGYSPWTFFGPPKPGTSGPPASVFPAFVSGTVPDADLLQCNFVCPTCQGIDSAQLADTISWKVIDRAQFIRGSWVQSIVANQQTGKYDVTKRSNLYAPKLPEIPLMRLVKVVGGYDSIYSGMTPREMSNYSGPHTHQCPCGSSLTCSLPVPKDPVTLACKRVQECDSTLYSPILGLRTSPSNWTPVTYDQVTNSYVGNGKQLTIVVDMDRIWNLEKERMKQENLRGNWGIPGSKFTVEGSDDAMRRIEAGGCAPWTFSNQFKVTLTPQNNLTCEFFLEVLPMNSSPRTCTYGNLVYGNPGRPASFVGTRLNRKYEVKQVANAKFDAYGKLSIFVGYAYRILEELPDTMTIDPRYSYLGASGLPGDASGLLTSVLLSYPTSDLYPNRTLLPTEIRIMGQ